MFGSLIVELCRQSQILLRKIVIVTLFFNRSVPQLKIHNFLPDLIWKTSLLPCFSSHLIHCSVFKVQFPVSFETRCKRSISWTLSSILKSPQAWIVLVEIVGIEPATSCLQGRRSPSWAISPSSSQAPYPSPQRLRCVSLAPLPLLSSHKRFAGLRSGLKVRFY